MDTDIRYRQRDARRLCILLAVLLMAICCNVHAKKIYKWVDENGKTHYGDSAPPNTGMAHEIHIPKTPEVDAAVNTRKERTERLLDAYAQDRNEKRESRETAIGEKKTRQANCEKARASQYKYQHVSTIYQEDENGNRVNLTDEQYAEFMTELQDAVDKWCS